MDCQKQKIQKKHPRENANLLSIVFFTYVFDTFRTGTKRELTPDDIYDVQKSYRSEQLCNRLEKEWKKELKKKNPSILKAFFRMFGFEYALWGVGIFVFVVLSQKVVRPLLIGKLMNYFEPNQNVPKSQGFAYIVGMLASTVVLILYDNTYLLSVLAIGLKLRVACSSLIYKKCLRLNLSVNPEFEGGKVVTLITKDVAQFGDAADFGHMLIMAIPRLIITVSVMYRAIGNAALIGSACLLLLLPINAIFGKLVSVYRLKTAAKTDKRLKVTQEIITAMRIIKMYTWEFFFAKSVNKLRLNEIKYLKILYYMKSFSISIGEMATRFALYICIITYIALGNHITADDAFVVVNCFDAIQDAFSHAIPLGVSLVAELKASLQRMTDFLMLEEVPHRQSNDCIWQNVGKICVDNVTVKTSKGVAILENLNLNIERGLTLVTGPIGVGKSTLLKLFLGDVHKGDGKVDVYGSVSYASQEPWLFPATIRQNILFGENFDENRYKEVVEVCALEKDINCLPFGDGTLVSDKGLNLSKGQKARINLARAVYKQADIYLIDDCFSSVDSGVGSHIFGECIKRFLKGNTCILVTHNSNLIQYTNHLLILNKGFMEYIDKDKTENNVKLFPFMKEKTDELFESIEQKDISKEEDEYSPLIENNTNVDNDMYGEVKKVGVVDNKVYYSYLLCAGGFKVGLLVLLFCVAAQVAASWTDYFVSFWVDQEQELSGFRLNHTTNSTEFKELQESHSYTMKLYSVVILVTAIFTILRSFVFFFFTSKASTNIHNSVLDGLLKTNIKFFDTNLSGNVLNRFSRDLGIIDEQLPASMFESTRMLLSLLGVFVVVSSINIYFIIPSALVMLILYYGRRYYLRTGRSLKRLEGAARSPLIGHLNSTMEGLTTIRANGAQRILTYEFDKHQDFYSSLLYMNLSTTFGFGLYIDLTCALYIAVICFTFLFLKTETQVGKIGLAITQSISIVGILQWGIRIWSELETQMTSTERILEYKDVNTENSKGDEITDWPSKGSILYRNVNLTYAPHPKRILKDINFKINSKEKIGVVGRTGAGKTSIISTMFRLYEFDGTITIDDVDITTVPMNHLRSKISIIPQDPVLFSGSVRSNLDPYSEYSDSVLWNALEAVEMKTSIDSLNKEIYEGGFDFSVGEKQLFCLARAIVCNNSILILDEATANIDAQTDSIIQKVIKEKFRDCTILTIAHKLNTVLDSDKVLVMDSGEVVQFGSPKELLKDSDGLFYKMVNVAGLTEID